MWLCNIRSQDGVHYIGRLVTEDAMGAYRDGPLYVLKDGVVPELLKKGIIFPMDYENDWYEGHVPLDYILD